MESRPQEPKRARMAARRGDEGGTQEKRCPRCTETLPRKRRDVADIRRELIGAIGTLKRSTAEVAAITLGQDAKLMGFDDPAITKRLTDAKAYADECATLIMRLFNAAVRKARKEIP